MIPTHTDGDDRIAYLFLDTETTGNRMPSRYGSDADQVWDIAWTLELGDTIVIERQMFVQHACTAGQWTREHTQYLDVMGKAMAGEVYLASPIAVCSLLASDIAMVKPAQVHLVGANPAFDQEMVNAMGMKHVADSWHYRPIDIEGLVAGRLNLKSHPGLRECAELIGLPKPPKGHDARTDVKTTRWLFWEFRRACAEGKI